MPDTPVELLDELLALAVRLAREASSGAWSWGTVNWTSIGATWVSTTMPLASLLCSMTACSVRVTPMP